MQYPIIWQILSLVYANPGYFEPCSAIALALEKGCIAVIGEPLLQREMVDCFKDRIVRPVDYGCLVL